MLFWFSSCSVRGADNYQRDDALSALFLMVDGPAAEVNLREGHAKELLRSMSDSFFSVSGPSVDGGSLHGYALTRCDVASHGVERMTVRLAENSYGESHVRLLRLARQEGRHDIKDLTLTIRFEGDFEAAHSKGDNRKIVPGDTVRNTVYALARQHSMETAEDFALHLIEHFLTYNSQVSRVHVEADESVWARLPHGSKPHASAFMRAGNERRSALLTATREATSIRAGVGGLVVMKTSDAAFDNFLHDPYTTLPTESNRILCTVIGADWLYANEEVEFAPVWHGVRQMLLEIFAEHKSKSLQHTLYAMGEAVLNNFENVREIHLSSPEKHFNLVDLAPLGMDNPGTVFLPLEEPSGVMQATLKKK
jgi:urate oxidase